MIEYIKGELTELTPALATIEAAGVGYGLNISLTTYSACQRYLSPSAEGAKKPVKLYVYEAIREDAYVLYGFYNKKEREMFELLITVSGVGANTARMMLSGMSVSELCAAISTGNAKLIPAGGTIAAPVNNAVRDEAVAALTMLGFSPAPTQKVVVQILQEQPALPVEQVVKLALKQIK